MGTQALPKLPEKFPDGMTDKELKDHMLELIKYIPEARTLLSSDSAKKRIDMAILELQTRQSNKQNRRMIGLTWAIAILTIVMIIIMILQLYLTIPVA